MKKKKNFDNNNFDYKEKVLNQHKSIFNKILGRKTVWCYFSVSPSDKEINITTIRKKIRNKDKCKILNKKKRNYLKCAKDINNAIKNSLKNNNISFLQCFGEKESLCIPLSENEKNYAILIICNIKVGIIPSKLELLDVLKTLLSDLLVKENELHNIKKTLHPRAIALSTIHTVHRILGSTLELNELLPQIARFCLQVIRANRCTVSLIDKDNKYLVPYVTVDLNDPDARSRKIKIGKGNIGKVAKTAEAYKSNNCICIPLLNENVIGTITVRGKQSGDKFNIYDEEILLVLTEQASIAINNAKLYEEQKKLIIASVKSLSTLLNLQIPSSYIYDIGAVEIAEAIGSRCELNQSEINTLKYATMLRNLARVGIPGEILLKPEELTTSEYDLIKEHSHKIVKLISSLDVLKPAIPILLHQRERYDGSGYPVGLKADEIPLGARIMSIIDAFEAMITSRPYKGTMNISDAVKELEKNRGTQFDPDIVDTFLDLINEGIIPKILRSHGITK